MNEWSAWVRLVPGDSASALALLSSQTPINHKANNGLDGKAVGNDFFSGIKIPVMVLHASATGDN